MRKTIALILVLLLSLLIFTGCDSKSNDSGSTAQQQNTQNPETQQNQQKTDNNKLQPPAFPED